MRRSIDKLMIGLLMILAVCLYAPTKLGDSGSNRNANEKVTEVHAQAPAPEAPAKSDSTQLPEESDEKGMTVCDKEDMVMEMGRKYYAPNDTVTETQEASTGTATYESISGDGKLTASQGVNYGPSGRETYYNLNMDGVVSIMQDMGYDGQYWVREDGVKMYGDYVMVAADLNSHPRGSLVESSLGTAIVVDTGSFAASDPNQLDIATAW